MVNAVVDVALHVGAWVETRIEDAKYWILAGFNRTFMELKVAFVDKVARDANGFNRTFMELKD